MPPIFYLFSFMRFIASSNNFSAQACLLYTSNIAKYQTGALFESPDGQSAVAIIKGQLAIAGQKTEGEWDWTTVINDNEIIVSDVFTGALYTCLLYTSRCV